MAEVRRMDVVAGMKVRYRSSALLYLGYVWFSLSGASGVDAGLTIAKKCGEVSCRRNEFCSEFDSRCHDCDSVCEESSRNYQEDVCLKDCQDYLHDRLYVRRDEELNEGDVRKLSEAVDRLSQLAAASLALSAVLLVLFAAFACLLWVRSRRTSGGVDEEDGNARRRGTGAASYFHGKINSAKTPLGETETSVSANNSSNALKLDISAAVPGARQPQGNSRQTPQPQAPPPPERTPASASSTAGGRSEATDAYSPATTTSTPLSARPPRFPSEDTTLDYAYDNRALTPSPRLEKDGKGNGSLVQQHQHTPPTPYHHPQQMGLGIKGETTF